MILYIFCFNRNGVDTLNKLREDVNDPLTWRQLGEVGDETV